MLNTFLHKEISFPKYFATHAPLSRAFVFPALTEMELMVMGIRFITVNNDCGLGGGYTVISGN